MNQSHSPAGSALQKMYRIYSPRGSAPSTNISKRPPHVQTHKKMHRSYSHGDSPFPKNASKLIPRRLCNRKKMHRSCYPGGSAQTNPLQLPLTHASLQPEWLSKRVRVEMLRNLPMKYFRSFDMDPCRVPDFEKCQKSVRKKLVLTSRVPDFEKCQKSVRKK